MRAGAALLDRDGTINRLVGYVTRPEHLVLLDGAAAAIRKLNDARIPVLIVTNQAVLAHGLCDEAWLDAIHQRLISLLADEGARIDGLYYCPHHPGSPFETRVAALGRACDCRKPNPGLLNRAILEWDLTPSLCRMFGDSTTDGLAALGAGVAYTKIDADVSLLSAVEAWLSSTEREDVPDSCE
jgi:histidinol-phosphate phosphatase family protein